MKKAFVAAAVAAAVVGLPAGSAAGVAEQAPHGGTGSHPHRVITGSGCVDINQVLFEQENHRGMHRAAFASGSDKGPWHGACP